MKIKKNIKQFLYFLAITATTFTQNVNAASCPEMIVNVISHSSGYIYFMTNKTCSNWCMVAGNQAFITQSYAMLLVAQGKKRPLLIAWPSLDSCDSKNPVYAVPDYFVTLDVQN